MENICSRTRIFAVHCGLRLVHLQKFTPVNEGSVSAFTHYRNSLCTFGKKKFLINDEQIFSILDKLDV